jgi:hypothetical protein
LRKRLFLCSVMVIACCAGRMVRGAFFDRSWPYPPDRMDRDRSAPRALPLAVPRAPRALPGTVPHSFPHGAPHTMPRVLAANRGQEERRVQFASAANDATVLLTDRGIAWRLGSRAGHGRGLELRLLHTRSKLTWRAEDVLAARANYFRGNDPRHWHSGVPLSTRARAERALPGVDWVVYGRGGDIEYDMIVSPGRAVSRIRFRVETRERVRVDAAGDILVGADVAPGGAAAIRMHRPVAYQQVDGERVAVAAAYHLAHDGTLGFTVGAHDPRLALVIDPYISITYDSFLGIATEFSTANSVVLDAAGNLYVGGAAQSGTPAYGGTPSIATSQLGPLGGDADITVTKINPNVAGAESVIYISYIGGTDDDRCGGIVVDSSGSAAIVGSTKSLDFPTAGNATQTTLTGTQNMVIARLDPTGSILQYSTYFGGSGEEDSQSAMGIAMDAAGSIYVTSDSSSTDLPATTGAYNGQNGGGASDGFLAVYTRTDATHYAITYCTYFGVDATVGSAAIAVDGSAPPHVYLGGFTSAAATSLTSGGFQHAYGGGSFDGFVMVLTPEGLGTADFDYATLLGGENEDQILALAIDTASPPNIYVTGTTQSTTFPVNTLPAAYQATLAQTTVDGMTEATDAFAAMLTQNNGVPKLALGYSTYLGAGADSGLGIAAIAPNSVYLAGHTSVAAFPAIGALQSFTGTSEAWLAKFDMTQSGVASLIYSTPLAGSNDSQANAVVADGSGDIFIVGSTTSPDYPAAGHVNTGFEVSCWSCATNPPTADGFVTEITEVLAPAPIVRMSAARVNLGAQNVGALNAPPQSVAVYNVGTAPLAISQMQLAGANSSDFVLSDAQSCGSSMSSGGRCSFSVGFTPSVVGTETAEVDIDDNASPAIQVVQLTGVGNGALATITPPSLNFGSVPVGVSNTQTITITNTGNATLTIAASISGTNYGEFIPRGAGGCYPSGGLAAGATCTINIEFLPTAMGTFSAFVSLIDNSGPPAGGNQTISLAGVGGPPSPVALVSPGSVAFSDETVGTPSGAQVIAVSNQGSTALQISSVGLTGANASEFQIAAGQTSCVAGGQALVASATCFIAVTFAPTSLGSKVAAVVISDNASPSTQQVVLTGAAVGPSETLSASNLAFGSQNVGTTSAPQSVTLANTGNGSLTLHSISITGSGSAAFSQTNTCGGVVYQNTQCNINVTYQPTAAGNQAATLVFADDAVPGPQFVQLSGTGQVPLLTLAPASLTFPPQLVGTVSTPLIATVTNTSAAPVSGLQLTFGGTNAGDFLATNSCSTTLAAGASCMVNVQFQPAASGSRVGTLSLSYLGTGSPATTVLAGASSDYSITVVNGSAGSASVTASQTATYSLSVAPLDGFSGNVSIACSGAPAEATCTVPASALDVSAAAVPFGVSVATQAGSLSSSRDVHWWRRDVSRRGWLWGSQLAWEILVLATALWCWRRPRPRGRRVLRAASTLLAAVALVSLAGCIGSSTITPTPTLGTPAGTYTLTVTGTTQGTSRILSLTLTVEASN